MNNGDISRNVSNCELVFDNKTGDENQICALVFEGCLMPMVGIFGLLGNFFSISVLSSKDMNNSFHKLLLSLTIFDSVFITFVTFEYTFVRVLSWPITDTSMVYTFIFPKVIYPLNDICLCCSIYTTIAVSYERCSAVCSPYKYRESQLDNKNRTFYKMILCILVLGIGINIPRFFETTIEMDTKEMLREDNSTVMVNTFAFQLTPLRLNPYYISFYINWTRLLTTCLVPLVSLVVLNYRIHRGIRYSHCRSRVNVISEINSSLIIISIVLVFCLCNVTRVILNCYEVMMTSDLLECGPEFFIPPDWFLCLTSLNHFSLVCNASVNFIIYLVFGQKFRQLAKQKLERMFRVPTCAVPEEQPANSPELQESAL